MHRIKPRKLDRLHLSLLLVVLISLYFNMSYYNGLTPHIADEGDEIDSREETITEISKDKALFIVQNGDTFFKLMAEAGLNPQEISRITSAITKIHSLSQLRVGQKVEVRYRTEKGHNESYYSHAASVFLLSDHERIEVTYDHDNDKYSAKKILAVLVKEKSYHSGIINGSLYTDAIKSGASPSMVYDFIHKFSHEVDFQRDIQPKDSFELYYERTKNDKGKTVAEGPLLYARLAVSNKNIELYRYVDTKGNVDYFDAKGQSIKRTLLHTPINGAKISSAYGVRRHPILGYSKMHKGLDYSAPTGTPILAAGDGVIEEAQYATNGYGRYVRIRHTAKYQSLYAHMERFAKGVRKGSRVAQGDIIGYVGSSGRSTGPHLHYEVIERGNKINPAHIQFAKIPPLHGDNLRRFGKMVLEIKKDIYNLKK